MTPAMKAYHDLSIEQQENNSEINKLFSLETKTPEQITELETRSSRSVEITSELVAAHRVLKEQGKEIVTDSTLTPEQQARLELRSRVQVGNIFKAFSTGKQLSGAEAEFNAELGLDHNHISTELWQPPASPAGENPLEYRAVTPIPTSDTGVNLGAVEPFVFAPSIASRLGIMFRQVESGAYNVPTITTAPSTAAPKAKSGAADATSGAISVTGTTPHRVPATLTVALEDIAAFGNAMFESSLREALSAKLSDSLDNQIINGSGSGANLNGLINQLTAPTAQGAEVTWSSASDVVAAFIDGLWATMLSEISVVLNPEGYRKLATTFQAPTTSGANGEVSVASYLMEKLSSLFTNKRMPDTPGSGSLNKNATLIVSRMGQPGLTRAIIPDWQRLEIDDPYTGATKGERHFTVNAIVGDVLIVQADAFALGAMQVKP